MDATSRRFANTGLVVIVVLGLLALASGTHGHTQHTSGGDGSGDVCDGQVSLEEGEWTGLDSGDSGVSETTNEMDENNLLPPVSGGVAAGDADSATGGGCRYACAEL